MIREDLLSVNEFHRRGAVRLESRAIVLHWVANPGTTPKQNRDFFESLKGPDRYASAHYVVGIDGEVIRCIPDREVAWHCGSDQVDPSSGRVYTDQARVLFGNSYTSPRSSPNWCTIGIELCHPDWTGRFTSATLDAAALLCADLCRTLALEPLLQIVTHHEVVGWKDCPKWFTENPDELAAFKARVHDLLQGGAA